MADFIVTTLDDEAEANDTLFLREALALANAAAGEDRITFAPELTGQIRLTQGAIEITDGVTIDGAGQITITGDAEGNDRLDADGLSDGRANAQFRNRQFVEDNTDILTLSNTNAEVQGLTLTGGGIVGTGDLTIRDSALIGTHFGAVNIDGEVALIGTEVRNNAASGTPGLFLETDNAVILGQNDVTVVNSTITGNVASYGGSGHTVFAYGNLTLVQTTVVGNTNLQKAYGGSVSARSSINIFNSAIAGDTNRNYGNFNNYVTSEYYESGITRPLLAPDSVFADVRVSNSIVFGQISNNGPNEFIGGNIVNDPDLAPSPGLLQSGPKKVFAKTERQEFRESYVTYDQTTNSYTPASRTVGIDIAALSARSAGLETAALSRFSDNPALNSGVGTLPSEADLGVDVDGDGALSTDPVDTDANGNPRTVGDAIDLGPVELQAAPEPVGLHLVGDEGDNSLTDGPGKDNMFGGRGADVFVLISDRQGDHIKDFELGVDRIDISAWGVSSFAALEVVEHRSGKLFITGAGEFLALRSATGPLAKDDLSADSFIFSDAPQSAPPVLLIQGTDGRDKLFGNSFDERLVDGAGIDNLFGRGGADTFVLVADGDADSIKDFEAGADAIDISAWGVGGFAELSLEQRSQGKVIVRFGDETLAIQDQGNAFSIDMLTADSFILSGYTSLP